MSKKNVSNAAPNVNSDSEPEGASVPDFNPADFAKVELSRLWFRAAPGIEPLYCLPLARSENVRELYPSSYKANQHSPLHVWAVELIWSYAKQREGGIVRDGEPVEGKRGDIVFLFEPARVRDFLARSHKAQIGIALRPIGKREIKSREHGMVQAWQWEAMANPIKLAATIDPSVLMLPTAGGAAYDMPSPDDE